MDADLLVVGIRVDGTKLLGDLHEFPFEQRRPFECKAEDAGHGSRIKGENDIPYIRCPDS